MINLLSSPIQKSWIQHLLFWVLSFYAIGSYFSISNELKFIDFIYSAFFHIPLLIIVYMNLRWAIPKFLMKGRYVLYGLRWIGYLGIGYIVHDAIFDFIIPFLPVDFYMVSFTDTFVLIGIFFIYLGLTTLLKLSKSWYHLQQLEKEKLSLELNALKIQVNPHFLFNSLNSIYSLARKKSDTTPDVILRLSDLMRYMIYEVSDEKVSIAKELEAIQNYLDLQKLRVEDPTDIQLTSEVEDLNFQIAPLLFFPLIENSFKHGMKEDAPSNYVHINLDGSASELTFRIKNNKGKVDDVEGDKYGGIGLENVRKRLALIYGDASEMIVKDEANTFEVLIKIKQND